MKKYLTFEDYDGSLQGRVKYPAGVNDVPSPGGLSSIYHHWTGGMFGTGEIITDVYPGTGERYMSGDAYGDMYKPNAHSSTWDNIGGPHTIPSQNRDLRGTPYFWNNKSSNPDTSNGWDARNVMSNHANREMYTPAHNIEMINPKDNLKKSSAVVVVPVPVNTSNDKSLGDSIKEFFSFGTNPIANNYKNVTLVIAIIVLILAAITFDFWTESVRLFMKQVVNKGVDGKWSTYCLYALLSTGILAGVVTALGAQSEFVVTDKKSKKQ